MLLSLSEELVPVHVGDVFEADFKKRSGTFNCLGYSGCVFAAFSNVEDCVEWWMKETREWQSRELRELIGEKPEAVIEGVTWHREKG